MDCKNHVKLNSWNIFKNELPREINNRMINQQRMTSYIPPSANNHQSTSIVCCRQHQHQLWSVACSQSCWEAPRSPKTSKTANQLKKTYSQSLTITRSNASQNARVHHLHAAPEQHRVSKLADYAKVEGLIRYQMISSPHLFYLA